MTWRNLLSAHGLVGRFWRDRSGASAMEFAIVGSVLVVVSIGIIEFGRAFFLRNDMAYAADVAVRLMMLNPKISEDVLETETEKRFDGQPDLLEIAAPAAPLNFNGMDARTITLRYPLTLMIPFLANNRLTLTVVRRVEVDS